MCFAAGAIGSFFTRQSVSGWYAALRKPVFNPPSSVFAPVWTSLYLMMGISLFLIWRKGLQNGRVRSAFYLFIFNLALNAVWSFAFFGNRSPLAGLIVICALWAVIVRIMVDFFRISRIASALLIPYIIWVSFAAVLNGAILFLNR